MEESVLKARAGAEFSVHIVWVPMLAGDDKDAADAIGATITDRRVRQYWDPNRLCGIAYAKRAFPNWLGEMVSSLPKDDGLRDYLKPRIGAPAEKAPMWDVAFLYAAGARWTDSPPRPDRWAKQVMFYGKQKDGPTGRFWRNDFAEPPFDSDWYDELARWTNRSALANRAAVRLTSLAKSLDPLRERFNKDKGKNRFVAILSPT